MSSLVSGPDLNTFFLNLLLYVALSEKTLDAPGLMYSKMEDRVI